MRLILIGVLMATHAFQLTAQPAPASAEILPEVLLKDPATGNKRIIRDVPHISVNPRGLYQIVSVFKPEVHATTDSSLRFWALILEPNNFKALEPTPLFKGCEICWIEVARLVCCDPPDQTIPEKYRNDTRHLVHSIEFRPNSPEILITLWPVSPEQANSIHVAARCPAMLMRRSTPEADGWVVCADSPYGQHTVTIMKVPGH